MFESRPTVEISQGKLIGSIEKSVIDKLYASFKGIPYAKPPIGDLRFRDPEPAGPSTSTLDASKFGSNCAQRDMLTNSYVGSDDCLYLNVYTQPDFTSTLARPVMVWIHGGAFSHGSGDDTLYGPDYIVAKDVVLVTINYRLGALGFLNLEDEAATGNQGLKDQVMALKWVQKNIHHFGGDPKNVTIFGESAGAASVHYLTLSPMADGLYHKAIAQSGVILNPWAHTAGSARKCAQDLAAILGEEIDDPKALVEFFRSVDALKLVEADVKLFTKMSFPGFFNFVPGPDPLSKNPFFPESVKSAIPSGVKVPFLLGNMSHEGIVSLAGVDDKKLKSFDSDFESALSPGVLNLIRNKGITQTDLREIYFGDKAISMESIFNYMQLQTDVLFLCGIHDITEIQATKTECPTYLYEFSYDSGESFIKSGLGLTMPGACHADDLPYILYPKLQESMGIPMPEPGSTKRLVLDRIVQMWTDLANTGNPTPVTTSLVPVIWKPVRNTEKFECLKITEDLEMGITTNVNKRYVEKSKSKL